MDKVSRDEKKKKVDKNKKNRKRKKSKLKNFFKNIFHIFDMKDNYSFSEVFIITIVSLVLGIFASFSIVAIFVNGRNIFKMSRELGRFYDAYSVLVDNYYGDIDKKQLIDDAIYGMVSSVDDTYTSYVDNDNTSDFDEMVSGIYEGIGCTILQIDDSIKIHEVYKDGPSDKAGLKKGDIIKSVDEMIASEVTVNELSDYIKHSNISKIQMVVIRDDTELTLTIVRDKVEIPSVSTKVYDKNNKKIGYMSISIFSSVSDVQFKEKLGELEKENIDGLIIDVRNNNGGYLSSVSEILSSLLPKGNVIYQVEKNKDKNIVKDKTNEKRDYPIAVLTNMNSASASEILAASIKESYHGFVVGTKTYGKGTVQQVKRLSDGSMIKYTVENWLTPKGNWINKVGVEPTHMVELTEEYLKNPGDDTDRQLQKALELVSSN